MLADDGAERKLLLFIRFARYSRSRCASARPSHPPTSTKRNLMFWKMNSIVSHSIKIKSFSNARMHNSIEYLIWHRAATAYPHTIEVDQLGNFKIFRSAGSRNMISRRSHNSRICVHSFEGSASKRLFTGIRNNAFVGRRQCTGSGAT